MHRYRLNAQPRASPESVVGSPESPYRFTILTAGLIRLEWSPTCTFEDRASTFATQRNLPTPKYKVIDHSDRGLEIVTSRFRLMYNKGPFTPNGLTVQVLGSMTDYDSKWRFGTSCIDLGGTARTLDEVDGATKLGPAVISRRGYAVIDDSDSMLFESDGWIAPRDRNGNIDIYLFVYGHDYRDAIRALYDLSSPQPLLPRWALGNWWSRFYAYTESEYLDLMDEFKRRKIPLSVAVIDMDWHMVRQDPCRKAGVSGWTGYTWDRSLFPDPSRFGQALHSRGLKLTLNDHPADGIHSYEEPYMSVAKELGHDTSQNLPIPFDMTNRHFTDAYFDILHRRIEDESGCDFWWIDWQQGESSMIPGIDPLWTLNHFHYLDNTRPGRHPLTFSRFAGPGSHRYPVGFSGDSIVSWKSLEFQPEFTNCASNIGYGWWSHDIGGHMGGKKDDELQTRWVQYGVFSPIMRLHSTANPWNTKEPWSFATEHCAAQSRILVFRHKLVPYLQTMNIQSARGGFPLCQPLYWSYPDRDEAYEFPNEYMFGSSLLVAPITTPRNLTSYMARTKAWLPPGTFVDIFLGTVYEGDRSLWLHRRLDEYPVLAPIGTILPLDGTETLQNGCPLPQRLEIMIIPGADASFDLLEECPGAGGVASLHSISKTAITYLQSSGKLLIEPTQGLHRYRTWRLCFQACKVPTSVRLNIGGTDQKCVPVRTSRGFTVDIQDTPVSENIELTFDSVLVLEAAPYLGRCSDILFTAQIDFNQKERLWKSLKAVKCRLLQASVVESADMDQSVKGALLEQIYASPI